MLNQVNSYISQRYTEARRWRSERDV